jgi:hypothetical protein
MVVAPPDHRPDELEALIKEARARHRRRRLLAAAAFGVAAAIGLTAYALTAGNAGRTSGASGSPSGAPLCRSSQLSVAALWDGGPFGNLFNFFTITNRGGGACSLPLGRPTVLLTRHGSQLDVEERAFPYPGKPVHTLAPGGRAIVHLDWENWCGARSRLARTTVTVRFAGGLRVSANLLGQPPCLGPPGPSVIRVGPPLKPTAGEL